jgi:hypothetical protein
MKPFRVIWIIWPKNRRAGGDGFGLADESGRLHRQWLSRSDTAADRCFGVLAASS